jgi:hypothetical protein
MRRGATLSKGGGCDAPESCFAHKGPQLRIAAYRMSGSRGKMFNT